MSFLIQPSIQSVSRQHLTRFFLRQVPFVYLPRLVTVGSCQFAAHRYQAVMRSHLPNPNGSAKERYEHLTNLRNCFLDQLTPMERLAEQLAQIWGYGIHVNIRSPENLPCMTFPAIVFLQMDRTGDVKTGDCLLVSPMRSLALQNHTIVSSGSVIYQGPDLPLIVND